MEYVEEKNVQDSLLANHSFLYLCFPLKMTFIPNFYHRVSGILLRLVWGQESCNTSFILFVRPSQRVQKVGVF